jgi:hypothetical protein
MRIRNMRIRNMRIQKCEMMRIRAVSRHCFSVTQQTVNIFFFFFYSDTSEGTVKRQTSIESTLKEKIDQTLARRLY